MQSNFLENYKPKGVYIIAEVGVNHNGNVDIAKNLIDIAKNCGADAVKFQTFNTDKLVSKNAPMAEYQKNNLKKSKSQYDMIKNLELSKENFTDIKNHCKLRNIEFISTPFDFESVDLLEELGVNIYKVGSGDCNNFLLLNKIIQTRKPVIISLGMSDEEEIIKIKNFMDNNNYQNKYIFFHCVSAYPAPHNQMNMSCVKTLAEKLNIPFGFSDHTTSDIAGIMSVAYGSCCIEKHITLDNNMYGPDHKASLNPKAFKLFVESIRIAEQMVGDGIKRCTQEEVNTKLVARKNLIYNKNKKMGDYINFDDLDTIRPNINGIAPIDHNKIINKKLKKDVIEGELIKFEDLE